MRWRLAGALALAVLGLSAGPSPAQDLAGARAFVQRLYMGKRAAEDAIYDAPMRDLMREDARLTPKDEVGALDFDPFCDCQDDDGLKVAVERVETAGPHAATAHVSLMFTKESPPSARPLRIDLVETDAGWRVHDIGFADGGRLREIFTKANAEATAARKQASRP